MYFESLVASLLVGVLMGSGGAFFYRRIVLAPVPPEEADTQLMPPDAIAQPSLASQVCVWDPHGCMNALNRLTMTASGEQERTLFAVADHMKFLALFIKSDGWCSGEQLTEWLHAWIELHAVLHPARAPTAVSIKLPARTVKIDTRPIGHLMLSHVAHAGPLASLEFNFSVLPPSEYPQLLEDDMGYFWLDCVLVGDPGDSGQPSGAAAPPPRKEFSTRCLALQSGRPRG